MKSIVLTLSLGLCALTYGQNTISKSGEWCESNLSLTVNLEEGATIVKWKKDGVLLESETSISINCTTYGKGIYKVVIAHEGKEETLTNDVTPLQGPTAKFNAVNLLAAAVTSFEDKSFSEKEIVAWQWEFSNGETSDLQNPKIMFAEQKIYTVKLTVTDSDGCSTTIEKEHEWAYK